MRQVLYFGGTEQHEHVTCYVCVTYVGCGFKNEDFNLLEA